MIFGEIFSMIADDSAICPESPLPLVGPWRLIHSESIEIVVNPCLVCACRCRHIPGSTFVLVG